MSKDERSTRERILEVTRRQIYERGLSHLTVRGVADELGMTKQAVLYWFPSKNTLLRELLYEAIEAESEVLTAAVERAEGAAEAIANFMRDGFAYHLANMPRFRLVYLVGQLERSARDLIDPEEAGRRLYPVTSRFYTALEQKLLVDPAFPDDVNARDFAVSLHMALIGHACMRGTVEAVGDDFVQSFEAMIEAMLGVLTRPLTR